MDDRLTIKECCLLTLSLATLATSILLLINAVQ